MELVLGKKTIFRQKVQIHKGGLADISDNLYPDPLEGCRRGARRPAARGGRLSEKEEGSMRPQLRIYYGPQEETQPAAAVLQESKPTVTVQLGEILPLLADAVQSDRTWLRDFADDEVTISMDLYEVLLAYQYYRRPVA
jgi:hypothetical protein